MITTITLVSIYHLNGYNKKRKQKKKKKDKMFFLMITQDLL